MAPAAGRVRAFDWLRGLSVIFMVECHALVLLRPALRQGDAFRRLDFFNGLVAPAFIFAAGFSLALTQVRGAKAGARGWRIRRTLRRLGEVLAVGTLLNLMWFWYPLRDDWRWLFRVDILQCIGIALVLALPLVACLALRPKVMMVVATVLGFSLFFLAPFGQSIHGPLAPLLNVDSSATFPLLPWAGYVLIGAAVGALAATSDVRRVQAWLLGLVAFGVVCHFGGPLWAHGYPPHSVGMDPANHADRWALVSLALVALLELERRFQGDWRKSAPVRWVELFGTSSLSGYYFHQALLYYQVAGFSFATVWKDSCGWLEYGGLLCALLALTTGLVWVTDKAYKAIDAKRPRPPALSAPAPSGA